MLIENSIITVDFAKSALHVKIKQQGTLMVTFYQLIISVMTNKQNVIHNAGLFGSLLYCLFQH